MPWILLKHVARNCIAPIMVFATVLVADAIVFEASLSFIGAGIKSVNTPTWGNMLSEGKELLLCGHWSADLASPACSSSSPPCASTSCPRG